MFYSNEIVAYTFLFIADFLAALLKQQLSLGEAAVAAEDRPEQYLEDVSLDAIVKYIQSERCKNIITMAGAGISTCKYLSLYFSH